VSGKYLPIFWGFDFLLWAMLKVDDTRAEFLILLVGLLPLAIVTMFFLMPLQFIFFFTYAIYCVFSLSFSGSKAIYRAFFS